MTAGRIRLMALVGLAALVGIWILQNRGPVQTKFLFVTVTMPQPALITLTLLVGISVGLLLALNQSGKSTEL